MQIPLQHVEELHLNQAFKSNLPTHYCHKYCSEPYTREAFQQDSSGDHINVAADNATVSPEYVASSSLVTPKYLVQARKLSGKLVKVCGILSMCVSMIKFLAG